MTRLSISVFIERDTEIVWDFVNNPKQYPQWMDFADVVLSMNDDTAREGTVYNVRGGFLPPKSEHEWQIEGWDPPQWQRHAIKSGVIQPTLELELIPHEDVTQLKLSVIYEFLPQFPRLGWWLEVVFVRPVIHLLLWVPMKSSLRKTARNIKREVETPHEAHRR